MPNFNIYTTKASEAVQNAHSLALEQKNANMDTFHIFYTMLDQSDGYIPMILNSLQVDIADLKDKIGKKISSLPKIDWNYQIWISTQLNAVFHKSEEIMKKMWDSYLTTEHLFLSILSEKTELAKDFLFDLNITYDVVLQAIEKYRDWEKVQSNDPEASLDTLGKYARDLTKLAHEGKLDPVIWREEEIMRAMQILSRRTKNNPILVGEAWVWKTAIVEWLALKIAKQQVPESLMNKKIFELDMWSLMAWTKYRWEFEERVKWIIKELDKSEGQTLLFIDEIHTLVWAGKTEWSMDMWNMLKPSLARWTLKLIGATTINEYRQNIEKDPALERRLQPIFVDEPTREDAIAILRWIKSSYETHHWVRITDSALLSAIDLSMKYIADRKLPDKAIDLMDEASSAIKMWISSMPENLMKIERQIRSMEIEKESLKLEETNNNPRNTKKAKELAKNILELQEKFNVLKWERESDRKLIIDSKQIKTEIKELEHAAEIAEKQTNYNEVAEIRYWKIPAKEKQLKEIEQKIEKAKKTWKLSIKDVLEPEDIALVISKRTWIPVNKLIQSERERLSNLESYISKRLIWQEQAISVVSDAIRRSRAWLQDPNRPIGSFLFLWPTWVWKTELAKALAEFLFDNEKAMTRIDMSEYMEKHSVSKLIWTAPGYVWYEEGGQLTEAVRRRPFSVILFDEVEKAHPDIFNILLQILDDARVTDSKWKTVDFRNTIIILTSNIWAEQIMTKMQEKLEKNLSIDEINKIREALEKSLIWNLQNFFRPEFLNRLDDIVVFNPLSSGVLRKIVDIQVERYVKMLQKDKDINLHLDEHAKDFLAQVWWDPVFGARPLKRAIQKYLLNPLSMDIISWKIPENANIGVSKSSKWELLEFKIN